MHICIHISIHVCIYTRKPVLNKKFQNKVLKDDSCKEINLKDSVSGKLDRSKPAQQSNLVSFRNRSFKNFQGISLHYFYKLIVFFFYLSELFSADEP